MRHSELPFRVITTIAITFLSLTSLYAQVDTGTIVGMVSDSTGAVIVGAKVTLINKGTNSELSTTSGQGGNYTFSPVRIGTYKLEVTANGFQGATQQDLIVEVGADVVVNFKLSTGSATDVVNVTAAPPALQTESSSVGQVVDGRQVDRLPLNGRNFTFLAQLSAGVNTP